MKPRSPILSQRENIKGHKKESWRITQWTNAWRALVVLLFSVRRLKLQKPEGKSKKFWMKATTGKKDLDWERGMAVQWKPEAISRVAICFLGLELFQQLFLSLCSKNKAMSPEEIDIIPGNWIIWVCQPWDHSVKHVLSRSACLTKITNSKCLVFKDFLILYRRKDFFLE